MSLDKIQLPPLVLQELFNKSLIDPEIIQPDKASIQSAIAFLGNNKKNITILVNCNNAKFLTDEELNFLLGILAACKLTMEDVSIINIKDAGKISYKSLSKELHAEKIFLFGVDPSEVELPLQFPHYQLQSYNKQLYLSSPLLSILQDNKAEKMKLWTCLKKVFSIN